MTEHLLTDCSFARETRFLLLRWGGWQTLAPSLPEPFAAWWLRVQKRVPKRRRKVVVPLILLGVWSLWLHRNARVFDSVVWSLSRLVESIRVALDLWGRTAFICRSDLDSG
jgi:hypothetical protein